MNRRSWLRAVGAIFGLALVPRSHPEQKPGYSGCCVQTVNPDTGAAQFFFFRDGKFVGSCSKSVGNRNGNVYINEENFAWVDPPNSTNS